MIAKSLKPAVVTLKRGDRVAVYRRQTYQEHNFTTASTRISTYSTPGIRITTYSKAGPTTCFYGYGFVVHVYEHIDACIVKLGADESRIFIKENDPQWSVYVEEAER